MPPTPSPPTPAPPTRLLTWPYRLLMLLLACAGFAAIWTVLAWSNDRQYGWMALIGALDVVWILRLTGWPAGLRRALVGVLGTAGIIALANWGIIAAQLGEMLGFDPVDSALRLGFQHAWELAKLINGPFELAMMAAALVLAAIASR
ncbi:hypothetical protein [Lysobacter tyrosinilyticus]